MRNQTGMFTDKYEITMLMASLRDGTAEQPVVFEVFGRRPVDGNPWGMMGGTQRVLRAVRDLRFNEDSLRCLADQGLDARTIEYLRSFRFSGQIDILPEGQIFAPWFPLAAIRSTFAQAVLAETVVLSILNHAVPVITEAARIRQVAAPGIQLLEMGSRRVHEEAAVEGARLAYVAGFDTTSNLEAGRRFGIPVAGTAAHAWTMLHEDETAAFVAQMQALGTDTTLLVDTYCIEQGIAAAVQAANRLGVPGPGAIRIDSGDLPLEAKKARFQLDHLGAHQTKIVLSGDLGHDTVEALTRAQAPVDILGVGTRVADPPSAGLVYKLSQVGDRPVAKHSATPGKSTQAGSKAIRRRLSPLGIQDQLVRPDGQVLRSQRWSDAPQGQPELVQLAESWDFSNEPELPTETEAIERGRRLAAQVLEWAPRA